jgi:hypothetical protein
MTTNQNLQNINSLTEVKEIGTPYFFSGTKVRFTLVESGKEVAVKILNKNGKECYLMKNLQMINSHPDNKVASFESVEAFAKLKNIPPTNRKMILGILNGSVDYPIVGTSQFSKDSEKKNVTSNVNQVKSNVEVKKFTLANISGDPDAKAQHEFANAMISLFKKAGYDITFSDRDITKSNIIVNGMVLKTAIASTYYAIQDHPKFKKAKTQMFFGVGLEEPKYVAKIQELVKSATELQNTNYKKGTKEYYMQKVGKIVESNNNIVYVNADSDLANHNLCFRVIEIGTDESKKTLFSLVVNAETKKATVNISFANMIKNQPQSVSLEKAEEVYGEFIQKEIADKTQAMFTQAEKVKALILSSL